MTLRISDCGRGRGRREREREGRRGRKRERKGGEWEGREREGRRGRRRRGRKRGRRGREEREGEGGTDRKEKENSDKDIEGGGRVGGSLIFSLEKSVVLGVVELFALHFVVNHRTMTHAIQNHDQL